MHCLFKHKKSQLQYVSGQKDHPFLNKLVCSLTGMAVNYTASGTYATYEDGTQFIFKFNVISRD